VNAVVCSDGEGAEDSGTSAGLRCAMPNVQPAADDGSRIWFTGNPWPRGHRVATFAWAGRLDDLGLWLDLHLETADYDEEGPGRRAPQERSWGSPSVWQNYHACTISSTKWGPDRGMQVGSPTAPFDVARGGRFRADPLGANACTFDIDDDSYAFHTYLLGHDTVADHVLRLTPLGGADFALDWRGRIALTYAGHDEFHHRFTAGIKRARLPGFAIADGLPIDVASDLLAVFTTDSRAYRLDGRSFVPA
jgi:hypothetical protein